MGMKVLIIDDSALMRKYLREILTAEPGIAVEVARDGQDGLDKIPTFDPDVITLDINMPVMDGLTCLSHIMTEYPRPVVMVSSLTEKGALSTFEALELGAVDYVSKPGGTVSLDIKSVGDEIVAKVRAAARSRVRKSRGLRERLRAQRESVAPPPPSPQPRIKEGAASSNGLVLVGVSTGGPSTVETIIQNLPGDFPWPIMVAQHMPSRFTRVFSERLDQCCALTIEEVDRPIPIEPGKVLVARGDADVKIGKRGGKTVALSVPSGADHLWHPSVERMVLSALEHYAPTDLIGVQLTGMGNDGAEAMTRLHQGGGRTIAESEESAVVYGMPRELVELGGADTVLPMEQIANQLCNWVCSPIRKRA